MVDTLFDEVSRIIAQPRPRRATLRLVFGTAAGAAMGNFFPRQAFAKQTYAWAPIPCGNTTCSPDAGQVCCDATLSLCCQTGTCLKDSAGKSVCCPTGKSCGNICCGTLETCCGGTCCATIAASPSVPPTATCTVSNGVSVCAKVQTCDPTVCNQTPGFACVNGVCKCDHATCAALSTPELTLDCNATTGTCLPV